VVESKDISRACVLKKSFVHARHFGCGDEVKAKFGIRCNFQIVERGLDDFSELTQINLAGALAVAEKEDH
jgi:hypothetical protein